MLIKHANKIIKELINNMEGRSKYPTGTVIPRLIAQTDTSVVGRYVFTSGGECHISIPIEKLFISKTPIETLYIMANLGQD